MSPQPVAPIAADRFALRLALFYAATFALSGAYMPFFPVWLTAAGLEPGWIGLAGAVTTLARLTAVPVVTGMAERRHAIREAIVLASLLTFAGFALLGQMRGVAAIGIMLWLTACAWTPILPMTDGYALRGVALYRIDYGPIRLWGSAAFAAGTLIAGALAAHIAAAHLIWIVAGAAGLSALASLRLAPIGPAHPMRDAVAHASALLRQPAFLAVIAAAALIQVSHAAYYTFSAIGWSELGFSPFVIAVLWAVCVIAEIVLFALSPRLRIAPAVMIVLGGAAATLRWLVMALEPSIAVQTVAQTLHAFSFGATHLGTMTLLARLAPGHVIASAQGYLVIATGVVTASAGALCGQFYRAGGAGIYAGMAAMALAGCLTMLLMRRQVERAAAANR
jgi:PPP family 3-phenylpropionic acid transporter